MNRTLRRFGFLAAFAALLCFVTHAEHVDGSHTVSASHHCCLCHNKSVSTAPVLNVPVRMVMLGPVLQAREVPGVFLTDWSPDSSRAPPVL